MEAERDGFCGTFAFLIPHVSPMKGEITGHHCNRAVWKKTEPQILFLEIEKYLCLNEH